MDITIPTSNVAMTTEDQQDADKTIYDMILQLIDVMYNPVKIPSDINTRSIGCQVGYMCVPCGLNYTTNRALKRHTSSVHDRRIYKCDMCGMPYVRESNLKKHLIKIHNAVIITLPK